MREKVTSIDHPIFLESIRYIQSKLGKTNLNSIEQQVLERLIHTSGDFSIQEYLRFSNGACESGILALKAGAPIITDTSMAASAIIPMAQKTLQSSVHCVLDWAPLNPANALTRTALGIESAWNYFQQKSLEGNSPIVVIGSAPIALKVLLDLITKSNFAPSLIVGMPVGFINVLESKSLLSKSNLYQIRIDGTKGGAALAAASVNALLRASMV